MLLWQNEWTEVDCPGVFRLPLVNMRMWHPSCNVNKINYWQEHWLQYTTVLSSSMTYQQVCNWINATVPLVEQELPTLPEHMRSPSVLVGFMFLVLCVLFCRLLFFPLSFFFLAIVLSVLRFTDSDYPFGIFKLFLLRLVYWGSWRFNVEDATLTIRSNVPE